jgi:HEAT repeat protein
MNDKLINEYIRVLDNENQRIRINAINQLGDIGDELCLKELRERLRYISQEHTSLVIAVGKLKKRLGIK